MLDDNPVSAQDLKTFYGVDGDNFQRSYKKHLSGFEEWELKAQADKWLVFPENLGEYHAIDETTLSNGELYTIIINKAAKGKKKSIVAIVAGTRSEDVIQAVSEIPLDKREQVKEVTLDMASNMNLIASTCFPNATLVIDRFHVQNWLLRPSRKSV